MSIDISQLTHVPGLDEVAVKIDGPLPEGSPDLIDGLLPLRGPVMVVGPTNVGKTTAALEITSTLITGDGLWGSPNLIPSKKVEKVLYILGEHSPDVVQRLWQKTMLPMHGKAYLIGPDKMGFDKYLISGGKPNLQAVNKMRRWAEGADLVVFDPLASFVVGADSENDNSQMRQAIELMNSISYEAGASSLILAHMGKPYIDKHGQEHARRAYATRGASGIEDAAPNVFYLQPVMGQSAAAAGAKHTLELFCRKYKGEAPESRMLHKDPGTLRHTLLDHDRPFVDAQRIETQAKYAQFQMAFPDASLLELYQMVAIARQCSIRTIQNHLGKSQGVVEDGL